MIETALVFSKKGEVICFHEPSGRTSRSIPDTRSLFDIMWEYRRVLGGVAHTHPGSGPPIPSHTDITTWRANERVFGPLLWPIATSDRLEYFEWYPGSERYMEVRMEPGYHNHLANNLASAIERLRELSGIIPLKGASGIV